VASIYFPLPTLAKTLIKGNNHIMHEIGIVVPNHLSLTWEVSRSTHGS
jgi:hypothetical protein